MTALAKRKTSWDMLTRVIARLSDHLVPEYDNEQRRLLFSDPLGVKPAISILQRLRTSTRGEELKKWHGNP